MKKTLCLAGLCTLLWAFTQTGKEKQVTGSLMVTQAYCGGAEPDPEELKQMQKPRPLAHKKCFVRRGGKNNVKDPIVLSFESDSAGNFMIYLPPGEYCIIDSRKYDKSYVANIAKKYKKANGNYSAADLNCLKTWLNTPDAVFLVKADKENSVNVIYHVPCDWASIPCVGYDGPLPP